MPRYTSARTCTNVFTKFRYHADSNRNWQPPCYLFELDVTNQAEYVWRTAASNFPDGKWTVGSWGPAPGIRTQLYSMFELNITEFIYPGTPDVGPFWRENVYTFIAGWNPHQDPSILLNTAAAAAAPAPASSGSRARSVQDMGRDFLSGSLYH